MHTAHEVCHISAKLTYSHIIHMRLCDSICEMQHLTRCMYMCSKSWDSIMKLLRAFVSSIVVLLWAPACEGCKPRALKSSWTCCYDPLMKSSNDKSQPFLQPTVTHKESLELLHRCDKYLTSWLQVHCFTVFQLQHLPHSINLCITTNTHQSVQMQKTSEESTVKFSSHWLCSNFYNTFMRTWITNVSTKKLAQYSTEREATF